MKYEWRKLEKELYHPSGTPALITVPVQKFIMIQGRGNPNEEDFSRRVEVLYSLAYAIKMRYKTDYKDTGSTQGYTDFTVYPLEGNAQFTHFAVKCMRIYLGGIFCAGFQIVSANYFQATGQPLKASVLSMLRQLLLLIPLLLILPRFFGLDGILYAGPVADISSAVIVACFILPEMRKLEKHIRESRKQQRRPEPRDYPNF